MAREKDKEIKLVFGILQLPFRDPMSLITCNLLDTALPDAHCLTMPLATQYLFQVTPEPPICNEFCL